MDPEARAALGVVAVCATAVAPGRIETVVARPRERPKVGALRLTDGGSCVVPRDVSEHGAGWIGSLGVTPHRQEQEEQHDRPCRRHAKPHQATPRRRDQKSGDAKTVVTTPWT